MNPVAPATAIVVRRPAIGRTITGDQDFGCCFIGRVVPPRVLAADSRWGQRLKFGAGADYFHGAALVERQMRRAALFGYSMGAMTSDSAVGRGRPVQETC
jgi:hypothetical protein